MPHEVECPNCGCSVKWDASSPWRPFCSERCKMIDLGAWFSEERAIPGPDAMELPGDLDEETAEALLSGRPGDSQERQ